MMRVEEHNDTNKANTPESYAMLCSLKLPGTRLRRHTGNLIYSRCGGS